MPRLVVGDRAVSYEDYGAGPLALLVHGSPGNGKAWQRVGDHLAARHRVVAPDMPGHGGTWPATHTAGYSALVVALRARVPIRALAPLEPVAVSTLSLADYEALHRQTRAGERYSAAALRDRLVRLSDGSPGQAMALAEPTLWEFRRKLLSGLFQPNPDRVALAQEWLNFVEEAGKESTLQRQRAALVVRLLLEFLRDALAVKVGGTAKLDDADELRLLEALANGADPEILIDLLERCCEVSQKTRQVVVGFIQGQPCRRKVDLLEPVEYQGGFAEPRWR